MLIYKEDFLKQDNLNLDKLSLDFNGSNEVKLDLKEDVQLNYLIDETEAFIGSAYGDYTPLDKSFDLNKTPIDICNEHYNALAHHFLSIFNQKGYLNRETQVKLYLASKPYNYILWYGDFNLYPINAPFYFWTVRECDNSDLFTIYVKNKTDNKVMHMIPVFDIFTHEEARNQCQKYLDDYLAKNNINQSK